MFTQHIGEAQDYHHISFRVELGGMVLFLPGDMTGSNWTGPLAGYPELRDTDLAMGSAGFVNLSTLAEQDPAVMVEAHSGGSCDVYAAYPEPPFTLSSLESFSIPIDL